MKRPRSPRHAKQTPDLDQLLRLALGLGESACRIEDDFWESRLAALIDRLLEDNDEATLSTALDQLYGKQESAYAALADQIEMRCESRTHATMATEGNEHRNGKESNLLLFVAPLLAWSRFTIPAGPIAAPALANIRVHLQAHVFASDVRLGLADFLFSPDQLPQSYCETAVLTDMLV